MEMQDSHDVGEVLLVLHLELVDVDRRDDDGGESDIPARRQIRSSRNLLNP